MARLARIVVTALSLGLLAVVPLSPASAAEQGGDVVRRTVLFEVANANTTSVPCQADGEQRTLMATMVGPRDEVLSSTADRVNLLVHDRSTGGWFWNLRSHPSYDYATKLARAGETSVVLDRLGYGA